MNCQCRHCRAMFNPDALPDEPAVQAGLILAAERYQDVGSICPDCLASRGRLAMMYDASSYH